MLLSEFLKIYKDKKHDESFLRMIFDDQPVVWVSQLSDKSMITCTPNKWLTYKNETPEEEIERRSMYRELYEYREKQLKKQEKIKEINCCRGEYEC